MNGYLRAYRAEDAAGEPDGVMTFTASTAGVKRDGMDIDQDRWMLDNYRRNPVVLWAHDYSSLPIGKADVTLADDALRARVEFDMADEFGARVYDKYQRGMLSAVSVGWRDTKESDGVWHELLDISAVPVPGDPDALAERTRDALRSMLDDLTEDDDNGDDEWPSWREAATGMVEVFAAWGEMPEAERFRRYRALLPVYRHHDRTAPEWVDDAEMALYDDECFRLLFLEGELDTMAPEVRAGAVLNARNKADLAEAMRLIQRVLDSAKGNDEKPDKPDNDEQDDEDTERAVDMTDAYLRGILEALQ